MTVSQQGLGTNDSRVIASSFIGFFISFFANYRGFFKASVDPKTNQKRFKFDVEEFVESQQKENRIVSLSEKIYIDSIA